MGPELGIEEIREMVKIWGNRKFHKPLIWVYLLFSFFEGLWRGLGGLLRQFEYVGLGHPKLFLSVEAEGDEVWLFAKHSYCEL